MTIIAQRIDDDEELPEEENKVRQGFYTNLSPYCEVNGENLYEQRVFELNSLAAFKARKSSSSLEGTGFDQFFNTLRPFLTQERIIAEVFTAKGLVRQVYQKLHETVMIHLSVLDEEIEVFKQKIQAVQPEFEQLVQIRDAFKGEIRDKSEHNAKELADDFCHYLSNLDTTFETDFEPYQPNLKVFELVRGNKREEFKENLEKAFNQYANDKIAAWTKKAELQLQEAFFELAESAETYGDAYTQVTDQISLKLSQQQVATGSVSSEEQTPGWTRWAGAAAGLLLGNPAGSILVGSGALNWKSLVTQFGAAVGANILLLYGAGAFLGPIGVGLVGALTGGFQLQQAKKKLTQLAKEEMKKNLPNIANKEKITVYNAVMEIFKSFEEGVTQRIDTDIQSRKTELDDLLAQKNSQEMDKNAEAARLNELDRAVFAQWNAIETISDQLFEQST